MELYFVNRPSLYDSYRMAINTIVDSTEQPVGLYIGVDDWEYPFWVLGQDKGLSFVHVGVVNHSDGSAKKGELPSYVIATMNPMLWCESNVYELVSSDSSISVLKARRPVNIAGTD